MAKDKKPNSGQQWLKVHDELRKTQKNAQAKKRAEAISKGFKRGK